MTEMLNVSNWRMGWRKKRLSFREKLPGWVKGGLIEWVEPITVFVQ